MRIGEVAFVLSIGSVALACGAPSAAEPTNKLMDRTTAGSNRCIVTKSHTRPFVIEWDATDLASFEAKAAHDVVFVRYAGCNLTVLDCSDSSLRGQLGAYRSPEWTSGTVEGFDMSTEQELYAQLPLGAAALAGRIESGEALRLRYFVSGVASATRDAVYRDDLPKRCAGATHFVQAYNLGAFELATSARTKVGASAGISGFGGGATDAKQIGVLKRGGELSSCRDEAARATRRCQVPIRITLREVEDGAAPAAREKPAGTGGGMTALLEAGKIRNAAQRKLLDGDGTGCLRDLERAGEIDPDPEHIEIVAQLHAQCTMRSGKCDAGKELLRAYYRRFWGKGGTPQAIDSAVTSQANAHCPK
jgi:hypothetical protein